MNIKDVVVNAASNPLDPENNLRIGYEYDQIGQTAAAVGFYLRAAEYGFKSDKLITYNALLRIALCFRAQGGRDASYRHTLMQAIEHMPTRPEAYFLLSRFNEQNSSWSEAYLWASLGLEHAYKKLEPLLLDVDYHGKDCLLFEKAVSAWWIGRKNESISLLIDLSSADHLPEEYQSAIKYNISMVSKLNKPNCSYEFIYGVNSVGKFYMPDIETDIIIHTIRNGSVYEEPIVSEFSNYVRPESVALDLGANMGQMTVALAKLCKKVYAFEPDQLMVEVLYKNLELNEVDNYEIIPKATWDISGKMLPFPEPDLNKYHSLGSFGIVPSAEEGRFVPSLAVDDLGLNDVSLIKVDVQGADLKSIQGLKETILRCKPAIIFEHEPGLDAEFNTSFAEYEEYLTSIGYKIKKTISTNNYLALPRE